MQINIVHATKNVSNKRQYMKSKQNEKKSDGQHYALVDTVAYKC